MIRTTLTAAALVSLVACAKQAPEPEPTKAAEASASTTTEVLPVKAAEAPATQAVDPHAAFAKLEVDVVAQGIKDETIVAVDANGEETRKEFGTLPGAVLLSNARTFELSELPTDKSSELVFYCGNEQCTSAPKAAARAREAGYTAVKVMPAGIRGWVKAGKPVIEQS
jgi:rhodanese-related sulfurtransferase